MVARSDALPKAHAFELVAATAAHYRALGHAFMVIEATNQWTGAACEVLGATRVHFAPFRAQRLVRRSMEPLADKWRSFGFQVFECNGHSVGDLKRTFEAAAGVVTDRPRAVICHTVKGKGIPVAEGNADWHHKASLSDGDLRAIRGALGS